MDNWIPIEWRELDEEEKEKYPDRIMIISGKNPDEGDEILLTDGEDVWIDMLCADDDYCYFDSGTDIIDVTAWMPLPEPYKGEAL